MLSLLVISCDQEKVAPAELSARQEIELRSELLDLMNRVQAEIKRKQPVEVEAFFKRAEERKQ